MRLSSTSTGILCLVSGIAIFSVQDLILKLISGDYPLHQAMMLRSLAAVPCLLLIVRWFDGGFGGLLSRTWPAMLGRGLLNFTAYTAYYLALAALPMATTVALYFTAPLLITAGFTASMNNNLFNDRMQSLPVFVYTQFANQGNPAFAFLERAWAAALVLILIVMAMNLIARLVAVKFSPKKAR